MGACGPSVLDHRFPTRVLNASAGRPPASHVAGTQRFAGRWPSSWGRTPMSLRVKAQRFRRLRSTISATSCRPDHGAYRSASPENSDLRSHRSSKSVQSGCGPIARRSKLSRRNLTTTIRSLPTSLLTSLLNSTRLRLAQTPEYYVTLDEGSGIPTIFNHARKSPQPPSICLASVTDRRTGAVRDDLLSARRDGKPHQGVPARPLCRPHQCRNDAGQPTPALALFTCLRAGGGGAAPGFGWNRDGQRHGGFDPPKAVEDRRGSDGERAPHQACFRQRLPDEGYLLPCDRASARDARATRHSRGGLTATRPPKDQPQRKQCRACPTRHKR